VENLIVQNEGIIAFLKGQREQLKKQQEQFDRQQQFNSDIEKRIAQYEHLVKMYTDHQIWKQRAEKAEGENREMREKVEGLQKELEKEKQRSFWARLFRKGGTRDGL